MGVHPAVFTNDPGVGGGIGLRRVRADGLDLRIRRSLMMALGVSPGRFFAGFVIWKFGGCLVCLLSP